MSDKEIISFLNTNRDNVCGNFSQAQLNREIRASDDTGRKPFISIAAIVAALTISVPSVARSKVEKIYVSPDRSDTTISSQQHTARLSQITGIVNDHTGDILIGASVKLDTLLVGTATDDSGRFELNIPSGFTEQTVKLIISYVGFQTQEVIVSLTANVDTADSPLVCVTMEANVRGGIKRAPLSYRIRHKIIRLFR
ncbi:carboxypeptidase-like regulatory domain-containing protein [Chitinophaga filiformis]|uniref:carboxypeptidase-like regulatory domain-containing protein n=1 Tax=Chitinophaga filiformis TaxID=104663 RepID=UPI001F271803|nr:carboxypeptidase-like regulatory domain-containing protein [Chitinophaga filiformis]MCF6402277.1 carboxypeptidase-like regulatory domain-containing protein [Chitinophaga filiformis]